MPFKRPAIALPISTPSRLRVNGEMAELLGVQKDKEQTDFIGFFRSSRELICVPATVEVEGRHPLASILSLLPEDEASDREPTAIEDLPSASRLVLANRIIEFPAKWNKEKNQLDLKVGSEVTRSLGYQKEHPSLVFLAIRGGLLSIMSASLYREAVDAPLVPRISV